MLSVPTLTSSTMLLLPHGATRTVRSGDVALGALGIVVCTAAAACVGLITTGRRFRATAAGRLAEPAPSDAVGMEPSLFMRSKKWIQLELSSRWEWADRRRARGFVKRWGALFDAYAKGRQWFGLVELGASIAAAVLAGLVPLDRGDGAVCQDLQVVSAVAAVAFLASVVLLRPYGVPMDERLAKGNAAATAASSVLGSFGVVTVILTAVQAILNSVCVLLSVGGFAAPSSVVKWWLSFKSGRVPRPPLPTAPGQEDRSHCIPLKMLHLEVVVTASLTPADRTNALEELILIICSKKVPRRKN